MKFKPFLLNHNFCFDGKPYDAFSDIYRAINTNSGNCYISYAICKMFSLKEFPGGLENIFEADGDLIDFDYINKNYSHAFLFLQDHLGAGWNGLRWKSMRTIVEEIKIPFVVFSLGVSGIGKTAQEICSEISDDAIDFFRILAKKSISIGVRGRISGEVCRLMGMTNYEEVGCPTYFECGPHRSLEPRAIHSQSKIAGLGWFTSANLRDVHYVLQGEYGLIKALLDENSISAEDAASFYDVPWPRFQEQVLYALERNRVHFFLDMDAWKDFFDGTFDLAVGTRMHGAIVAINGNCPAIVTAGDVRAQEMCELFKIPHYPGMVLIDATPAELMDLADPSALNLAYPELYDNFRDWLQHTCGLPIQSRPSATLDWHFKAVHPLPGGVAAERIRGAHAIARHGEDVEQLRAMHESVGLLQQRVQMLVDEMTTKSQAIGMMSQEITALRESTSWRITRPLRVLSECVRWAKIKR